MKKLRIFSTVRIQKIHLLNFSILWLISTPAKKNIDCQNQVKVLGVGSNTLIRDGGYKGIIIKFGKALSHLSLFNNNTIIAGSAALDMANVAAGRLDGFWGSGLKIWDLAAGGLLVQEAGGMVSDYLGKKEYLEGGNIICSAARCYLPTLDSIKPFVTIKDN